MNGIYNELKYGERVTLALRRIYEGCGYTHFRMSKFEPYDLYAGNKDFLQSESILTFTDHGGRLLALKPDVTISIIKNSDYREDGATEKYYYNENVYRIKAGAHSFGELLQTGVECIGNIGAYETSEVVMMAIRSLGAISDRYILDVSSMGIVSALLKKSGLDEAEKRAVIKCIGEKSAHGILAVCADNGVDDAVTTAFLSLVGCCGKLSEAIDELTKALFEMSVEREINELRTLSDTLSACGMADNVRLDFSVVYDRTYYNGIVFRGFIDGIPERVLSGGRYDLLIERMDKRGGGIGFAVYADSLYKLEKRTMPHTDVLILTLDGDDSVELSKAAQRLISDGKSVLASNVIPERRTFGKIMKMSDGVLTEVEDI